MEYLERAEGSLVGLAVGDALGANWEFWFPSAGLSDSQIEMIDGQYPAGAWTDDTSMALCLADSLLACSGYDSYDVMERYRRWVFEGYRAYDAKPAADVGGQVREAIDEYMREPVVYGDRVDRAGNGALMRLAPAVIAQEGSTIQQTMELARVSARETHFSEVVEASAEILAAMIYRALLGLPKVEVVKIAEFSTGPVFSEVLTEVIMSSGLESQEDLRFLGGYTVDALKIAVWGLMNFPDFETGVREVIKLGGDTDTNAAIYGQLAGAFYGLSGIPLRWREKLLLCEEICGLAEKLSKMPSCPIKRTRFEEDTEWFLEG